MNQAQLLKKLLPGLIPLFVFIIADEIWGMKVGLGVALGTGIIEMLITWVKEKRTDKFIILDTALLTAFSGISILLENDLYFKLKPAFLEAILAVILGLSAFSGIDIVGSMTRRYMKGVNMTDQQEVMFKQNLRNLFFLILGHILLIIYAAFFMSNKAWVFISGVLLYIIVGLYFAWTYFKNKMTLKNNLSESTDEELLPLVDEEGKVIGRAPRSACHKGDKLLHPVVHLHVLNQNGHIYLQKRPLNKLVQPGKWDTSVGGHISFGETLENALTREAYEEIGLQDFSARFMGKYRWDTEIESELVYYFITYDYLKIRLHSEEVEEGKFWSPAQIEKQLGKGVFTPNFEYEYVLIRKSGSK